MNQNIDPEFILLSVLSALNNLYVTKHIMTDLNYRTVLFQRSLIVQIIHFR